MRGERELNRKSREMTDWMRGGGRDTLQSLSVRPSVRMRKASGEQPNKRSLKLLMLQNVNPFERSLVSPTRYHEAFLRFWTHREHDLWNLINIYKKKPQNTFPSNCVAVKAATRQRASLSQCRLARRVSGLLCWPFRVLLVTSVALTTCLFLWYISHAV